MGDLGFTKTLALEVRGYGIRANAVCPGSVEGDRMDRVIRADSAATGRSVEELRAEAVRHTALKTFVSPQSVADMIMYLCSDAGRRISRQAITVDAFTYSARAQMRKTFAIAALSRHILSGLAAELKRELSAPNVP